MQHSRIPRTFSLLLLFGSFELLNAEAGCLESAPKPSHSLFEKCLSLGTFGMNRGAYSRLPYETADDGLEKEHFPPKGPRSALLDFTKKNTGRLLALMESDLPEICSYYYEGVNYNLKNNKDKLALHLRKHKAPHFEKALLKQVFEKDNNLSVADMVRLSKEFSEKAIKLGDAIFKDQLIPHAGSLEPSYQKNYLKKMNATLASLKGEATNYAPSDCDYLNAPINHLYGLIQLSRLTAAITKSSCPVEYNLLDLESQQAEVSRRIDRDWKASVRKAVLGKGSRDEMPTFDDAGNSETEEERNRSAK